MGVKEEQMSTTTGTKDDIAKTGVGQAGGDQEQQERNKLEKMAPMGTVAADTRRNLGTIKEKLSEKLASASVPADSLENARHFVESVIRDVTVAAHGLTKDALLRIKTHLADLLPSLSPNITRKMVDDAEKEAIIGQRESSTTDNGEEEDREEIHHHGQNKQDGSSKGAPYMSPASSLFGSLVKPLSRL